MWQFCITVEMQCISRHLQLTLVESALCCSCLEPLFSLGSQTACTPCTFSTLPGVIVPGTGSQPSYTASSEQAPIHFTAENSKSGTISIHKVSCVWIMDHLYVIHIAGYTPILCSRVFSICCRKDQRSCDVWETLHFKGAA